MARRAAPNAGSDPLHRFQHLEQQIFASMITAIHRQAKPHRCHSAEQLVKQTDRRGDPAFAPLAWRM
jgi:hypothetical protein